MDLKIVCSAIGMSISILLSGCGSNIAGEENLPSACLKYKSKAQEVLQPFPGMLNEVEQIMLDINQGLPTATPEMRSFMIERCTTLLADLKEIEKDASQGSYVIQLF